MVNLLISGFDFYMYDHVFMIDNSVIDDILITPFIVLQSFKVACVVQDNLVLLLLLLLRQPPALIHIHFILPCHKLVGIGQIWTNHPFISSKESVHSWQKAF